MRICPETSRVQRPCICSESGSGVIISHVIGGVVVVRKQSLKGYPKAVERRWNLISSARSETSRQLRRGRVFVYDAIFEHSYGKGRWRKMKGFGTVQFPDGTICEAEIHWYEASGIGRRKFKIKRILV